MRAFRTTVIGEGVGMMAHVARLELDYAGERGAAPASLIIKMPTPYRRNRGSAEMLGLYEREIRFYAEFAPTLPVRVPRAYYGDIDPVPVALDSKAVLGFQRRAPGWLLRATANLTRWLGGFSRRRAVLLLEDLRDARPGDQVAGGTPEDWGAAIDALATLHAGLWQSPRLEVPYVADVPGTARVAHALQVSALRRFRRDYASALDADADAMLRFMGQRGIRIHDALCASPPTLLHMDYRLDNLFFDSPARSALTIIDWQLPSRGPGVFDLAYFLGGTLGPDCTRDDERALVARYHATLVEAGVRDYDAERCWREYQLSLVLMLQRLVAAADAAEFADARSTALLEVWVERLFARLRGLDPTALLLRTEQRQAADAAIRP